MIKSFLFLLFRYAFVIGFCATSILSCVSRNELEDIPKPVSNNCDTSNVTFAQVSPILSRNCYQCHGERSNSKGAGIILEGYTQSKSIGGKFILERVTLPTSDVRFMPKGGSPLSTCEINIIKAWVNQGEKE